MKKINLSQKIKYSFLNILTGSDLSKKRLPLMEAKSVNSGPVVWLTACAHGDELGGIVVIQEIFKILRKKPLLKGTIFAFPLKNPIGFETTSYHVTLSEEDLNRSFPGGRSGSIAERIADKIFTTITKTNPTLVLDLHNDWRQTVPYVLIDPSAAFKNKEISEKVNSLAKKTGLIMIGEQEESIASEQVDRSLTYSLVQKNIPAITMELGESDVVNEKNVEIGIKSIWNVLSDLGMVEPSENYAYPMPDSVRGKILRDSAKPSSTSGIIRFLANPGDIVKKGQPFARVYNAFGKIMETIVADNDCLIIGFSDTSVAFPGVPVMALGIIE